MPVPESLALHYEALGNGETVILLHGLLGTGRHHWSHQYPKLARRFRVILPDLRGHGRTPPGDGFQDVPAQVASDVLALMQTLGVPRAHVVGLSLGGYAALCLGVRHSDRLLSLTVSGVIHDMGATVVRRMAEQLNIFQGLRDDPRMAPARRRHRMLHWFDLVSQVHADLLERPVHWTTAELGQIECPVLILQGDRLGEEVDSALVMRDAVPGAELCLLPGAGHTCQWDRPGLYTAVLLDFLSRYRATVT